MEARSGLWLIRARRSSRTLSHPRQHRGHQMRGPLRHPAAAATGTPRPPFTDHSGDGAAYPGRHARCAGHLSPVWHQFTAAVGLGVQPDARRTPGDSGLRYQRLHAGSDQRQAARRDPRRQWASNWSGLRFRGRRCPGVESHSLRRSPEDGRGELPNHRHRFQLEGRRLGRLRAAASWRPAVSASLAPSLSSCWCGRSTSHRLPRG